MKTSSDDGVGHPWQGPLLTKKKNVPFSKSTYIADFDFLFEKLRLCVLFAYYLLIGFHQKSPNQGILSK